MKILTDKEMKQIMDGLREKYGILETAIRTVTQGYCPAFFLWGPPGMGKSYLLRRTLDALVGHAWQHHTAYSTPKGLVLTLAESPDTIHVFEDCERMMRTDLSASILRAACGAPSDRDRWVTYETANERLRFKVTGGVIVVSNENLSRSSGPMQAVASRFRPLKWDMTQQEVVAVIQSIAKDGWSKGTDSVTPKECMEVAGVLIDMIGDEEIKLSLDIRLFCEHALPAYAYCRKAGQQNWKDIVRSKLLGQASTHAEGQRERTRRLEDLALSIHSGEGTPKEKVQKWKALTSLGQAIYYRHVKAAKSR